MKAYIGDLQRSEVIKYIYDDFRNTLLNNLNIKENREMYVPELTLEDADKQINNYIGYLNGVYLHMGIDDNYLTFNDGYSTRYVKALFNLKRDKCLIINNPASAGYLDVIDKNTEEINKLEGKIGAKKIQLQILGIDPYKNFSEMNRKNVIKNSYLEGLKFEAYHILQELKAMERELITYKIRNNNMMLSMINNVDKSKSR